MMMITQEQISEHNHSSKAGHEKRFKHLSEDCENQGISPGKIIEKLHSFQVAIPSWALGTGGTRFGRFPEGGEPRNLEEKIADVGLIHQLNTSCGAISLHIPWDIPENAQEIKDLASSYKLKFDAVNSNTFQDQPGTSLSYKYGSLSHVEKEIRVLAIQHNKEVIDQGISLGSKALTVWLADGSAFPGQHNMREALQRTIDSLGEIYSHLPEDWKMLIEYKPFEPNFYSMVIPDWGTSQLIAGILGQKARTLVDLGHHLPNTNIEQIVATLMMNEKLGGFHFNDSKYADDDLTVGSINPYKLFLIFNELVDGMGNTSNPEISWMIDASHNIKDPLEDLMQSLEAILIAYTQALLVDRDALKEAQNRNDVVKAQQILQDSFRKDVRSIIAEARKQRGGAIDPIRMYRDLGIRKMLVKQRGQKSISTGL